MSGHLYNKCQDIVICCPMAFSVDGVLLIVCSCFDLLGAKVGNRNKIATKKYIIMW